MPRDIVYFDLETQRTANDAGGWARKGDMRMSVGVIFSTATGRYEVFGEAQVNRWSSGCAAPIWSSDSTS